MYKDLLPSHLPIGTFYLKSNLWLLNQFQCDPGNMWTSLQKQHFIGTNIMSVAALPKILNMQKKIVNVFFYNVCVYVTYRTRFCVTCTYVTLALWPHLDSTMLVVHFASIKLKAGKLMGSWWRGGTKDGDGWRCFSRCCKSHISRKMLKIYAAAFAVIVSSLQVDKLSCLLVCSILYSSLRPSLLLSCSPSFRSWFSFSFRKLNKPTQV